MEIIKLKVNAAITKLFKNDLYLLENDLNERTITHKLGAYLQEEFNDFDVDCEYNKNIDEQSGLKIISLLEEDAIEFKRSTQNPLIIEEELHYEISIFPDIIIHKRGLNINNLLIIEVKKSSNKTSREFDEKKLERYTTNVYNKLKYKHGLFIEFETKVRNPKWPKLMWYRNGSIIHSDLVL